MAAKDTFKQGYIDAIEEIKKALANKNSGGASAEQDFPDIPRKLNPPPVFSDSSDDNNSDNKSNSSSASSGSKSNDSSKSKKKPQIGDHGDPEKQAEEEAQRQKEGSYDPSKQSSKSSESTKGGPGGEATNDADFKDQKSDAGKYAEDKDLEDRIKQIKDILSNPQKWKDSIDQENTNAVSKEKAAKAARDAARYRSSPLTKFKESLNQFIKTQTAVGRGSTWRRPNRKYTDSGLMRPGKSYLAQTFIPVINVYFDMSGSWTDQKIKVGEQAIATLNEYVHKGEIEIKVFYFAVNVHENRAAARAEGGTCGQPILSHIQATKPTNVIIMTDSDISDCYTNTIVPGAVWLLFKEGVSQNLIDHIKGKTQTRRFEI